MQEIAYELLVFKKYYNTTNVNEMKKNEEAECKNEHMNNY